MIILFALLQAADPPVALHPPAPPQPAMLGSFRCDVRDRNGAAYTISGQLRRWRNGRGISDTGTFSIEAPASTRLSGEYDVVLTGHLMVITNSQQRFAGLSEAENRIILDGPMSGQGTIMIKSFYEAPDRDEEMSSVGFCTMAFRTASAPP